MIPTPKPDRVRGNPGETFKARRVKARSGAYAGKKYPGEFLGGTTTAQSVSGKRVTPQEVISRAMSAKKPAKTPMTGHDARVIQHPYKPPKF